MENTVELITPSEVMDDISPLIDAIFANVDQDPIYVSYDLIPRAIAAIDQVVSYLRVLEEINGHTFPLEESKISSDIAFYLEQRQRFVDFQESVAEDYLGKTVTRH